MPDDLHGELIEAAKFASDADIPAKREERRERRKEEKRGEEKREERRG